MSRDLGFDKKSLFGGASIGKLALCVKAKRAATYVGSGLMYRLAGYENAGVGEAMAGGYVKFSSQKFLDHRVGLV